MVFDIGYGTPEKFSFKAQMSEAGKNGGPSIERSFNFDVLITSFCFNTTNFDACGNCVVSAIGEAFKK